MPKTIKNAVETEFRGKDRMTRSLGVMSRGMQRLNRMAGRVKSGLFAAGKAVAFLGRAMLTGLKFGIGAAIGGIGALTAVVWKLSSSFSMIEDAQAGFTPLMGSVEGATKLVDELNKTAATTPFQFETLSDTAKQLLPSMNGNIERTIQLTRMLGDTAGGNAQKLESITRGYNKALIKGKVDLESLNMIAEAGVPIFQQMSKAMDLAPKKLFKWISAGKIHVDDLTDVFKVMTSEGGIFFRGMEIASETLSGKISTLKDNANLAMAEFGRAMAPTLKEAADEATRLAQKISAWAKENQDLIRTKFKEYFDKFVKALKDGYRWIVDNKEEIKKFGKDAIEATKTIAKMIKWVWSNKYKILAIATAFKGVGLSLKAGEWIASLQKATTAIDATKVAGEQFTGSLTNGLLQPLSKQELMNQRWMKMSKIIGATGPVIMAFTAGWQVGSAIFDNWFASFDRLEVKLQNMAAGVGMKVGGMSKEELSATEKQLKKNEEKLKLSNFDKFYAATGGPLGAIRAAYKYVTNKDALETTQKAQLDVSREKQKRTLFGGVSGQKTAESASASQSEMPQAQVSRSETVTREVTEVVIRDETGRAEVTKGKSTSGLTLAHTGGM